MHILRERRGTLRQQQPNERRLLQEIAQKRCGVCWDRWPASEIVLEDGQERCPKCAAGPCTPSLKAETEARELEYAMSRTLRPQVSQAPLNDSRASAITSITDANGAAVSSRTPLRLRRGTPATLDLAGTRFSSSDLITASGGITASVSSRTTTQTVLSISAGLGVMPGDHYHLTFNDFTYRDVLSVR